MGTHSKTELVLANRVVLLSQSIPRQLNDHRPLSINEAMYLTQVMGIDFVRALNNSNISIYLHKTTVNVPSKNTDASSSNSKEIAGLAFINYERNQYSFIFRNRIIMLTTYLKIDNLFNYFLASKIVQFDFMFLEDYLYDVNGPTAFNRTKQLRYVTKNKFDMSGIRFLLKMLKIIESVSTDVTISVCYLDEQRGRIYKKALSHLTNVKYKKVKPRLRISSYINN